MKVSTAIALLVFAAQAQPPIFRARTDLVRLDVVVVDADGNVVRGLTRADFQVVDRGRVRELTAFEEVAHAPVAVGGLPMAVKRDVADNAAQSDRLVVLSSWMICTFKPRPTLSRAWPGGW